MLLILDGWGISDDEEWNAIRRGETPFFDRLDRERPFTPIDASGEAVGLPAGQMGNSEVGHLNFGAGRVVYQDLLRISSAVRDGSFFANETLLNAVNKAIQNNTALHLCGLVSDGGVHSAMEHITALVELARKAGLSKVFIHALTDGRDTPPDSGLGYITDLEDGMERIGAGKIATVQGRFYGMDRDSRWERVKKGYDLMVHGEGARYGSAVEAIRANYDHGVTDEFIDPCVIMDGERPVGLIGDGDELIMFNFRADRMRQVVRSIYDPSFAEFNRGAAPRVNVTCLTEYDARFGLGVAFENIVLEQGLGQVLAENGKAQFRTAETEKYAHVTFFFNGGQERMFEGESRKLIPSPRVRTYDLKPEMSCVEVADTVIGALESNKYHVVVANLANGDMVGHTGVWEAALKAVNVVDVSVERIAEACGRVGAELLITADHGNIECMIDDNGKPMTAHTTNQVPFYYVGDNGYKIREGGRLADIAPTILKLLNITQPKEMTGSTLLV